jgi:hypothetical protein
LLFASCSDDEKDDPDDPKVVTYTISYQLDRTEGDASSYKDFVITYTDADGTSKTLENPDFPWTLSFDGISKGKSFNFKTSCTLLTGKSLNISGSVGYTGTDGSLNTSNVSLGGSNPVKDIPLTSQTSITTPSK